MRKPVSRVAVVVKQERDLTPLELAVHMAHADTRRLRAKGKLPPLGTNPETGKRIQGTGRYPTTGFLSPMLPKHPPVPSVSQGRWRSRRERATELQARMAAFSAIYNAGWLVRDAYFSADQRRRDLVMKLIAVILQELRATQDYEACVFAIADALYASPLGVPWEP